MNLNPQLLCPLGWSKGWSGHCGEEIRPLHVTEVESGLIGHPTNGLVQIINLLAVLRCYAA